MSAGDDCSKKCLPAVLDTYKPTAHAEDPQELDIGAMKQRDGGQQVIEQMKQQNFLPFGEADQSQMDRGLQDYVVWQSHCIPTGAPQV